MIVRAKIIIFHQGRYYNPGDEVDISEKALARLEGCYEKVRQPPKRGPKRATKKKVAEASEE